MAYAVGYAQFGALVFALMVIPGWPIWPIAGRGASSTIPCWIGSERDIASSCGVRCADPASPVVLGAAAAAAVVAARRDGLARIPARARRGLDLASCRDAARDFAATRRRDMTAELRARRQRVSRGLHRRDPARPQRRRHRSVDALARRGGGRAASLRQLARGRDQAGRWSNAWRRGSTELPGLEVGFSQPIIDGVLDKVFDAHSELAIKVVRRRFRRLAPHRQGHRRRARTRSRASATSPSIKSTPLPQIAIEVDRVATARYGINVADVADLIQDRHRRRRREPGLHRRAPLRHDGSLSARACATARRRSRIWC